MEFNLKNNTETTPHVSIIILNWNGWKDTIECLESVYQITYPNYDVIVVDNGSENDSLEQIRNYCQGNTPIQSDFVKFQIDNKPIHIIEYEASDPKTSLSQKTFLQSIPPNKRLRLVKNDKNEGFTEGNNIAMRFAINYLNSDYVLLLNNDTVVDRNFLTELIHVGERGNCIGFVGPKIYQYNYNGSKNTIQFAGGKQNIWIFRTRHIGLNEIDVGQYDKNYDVDYVHGSCLLAKVSMVKKIGMLDNTYVSFREENDWGIRGFRGGWKSVYAYRSKIWHKGGGSTKIGKGRSIAIYYMVRNEFLFMKKHAKNSQQFVYLCNFFIRKFWYTIGILLIHQRNVNSTKAYLNGTKDGLKILMNFE
ncbi:glycosyltransferase family 2 protein [Methanogenium organophilum]|uniref:Glycosyltransferase family 2 protein n=1 Tax=Methanogenium organophilum TaxID=2199 RepID=A0A9X9S3M0_METOG|nr:glycosyltransferase family 2 protein [Methanogenium organophilum]WAI01173.1 glycosyltransferase family 2 protein [Methanogenium organophilum]